MPGGFWLVSIRTNPLYLYLYLSVYWSRPVGRPYTSWMATLKSDTSLHNLACENAIELALDKSLWRLLVASGAMHWHGACRIIIMMMMMITLVMYVLCTSCHSGRSVMLEQPRRSSTRVVSHMLTSHGGEIYIHTLVTSRSILEDSPSISEGAGGRLTDYRISVSKEHCQG